MHRRRLTPVAAGWAAAAILVLPSCAAGPRAVATPSAAEPAVATGEAAAATAEPTPAAAEPTREELERFSGLYHGAIVYRPAEAELESIVEIGLDPQGRLTGTIDQPGFFEFQPLEDIVVRGDRIDFSYRRFSEVRGPDALFAFEGRLVDGGAALEGEFLESRGRIPFRFERIGDVGMPRPEPEPRPLTDLTPEGAELRTAFNAAPDHARLVLLLSPS